MFPGSEKGREESSRALSCALKLSPPACMQRVLLWCQFIYWSCPPPAVLSFRSFIEVVSLLLCYILGHLLKLSPSCCVIFQVGLDGEAHIRVGKLNLVDLAGSERQAKTGAEVIYSPYFLTWPLDFAPAQWYCLCPFHYCVILRRL